MNIDELIKVGDGLVIEHSTQDVLDDGQGEELQLTEPPLYQVLLHNDDYTPMDFVVEVLEIFFDQERSQATEIMMSIHRSGVGLGGVYPFEIAETKVAEVSEYAEQHEHPLQCTMVMADDQL